MLRFAPRYALRFLLLALAVLSAPAARACDACGCFLGLTPYDNQSSVSVLHRFRSYNGYGADPHRLLPDGAPFWRSAPGRSPALPDPTTAQRVQHDGHEHAPSAADFESYQVDELRLKYFLARRLEVSAFVPYLRNTSFFGGETTRANGLGDVSVLVGYHLIRRVEVEGPWQHRLILGGGLKLPTGANNRRAADGKRVENLSQPGSGALDGFGWLTYVGRWRKLGLSLNSSYKWSGTNAHHESLAPAFTQYASLFYLLPLGENWRVLPAAQAFYESTAGETWYGERTGEHAARNLLVGPGLDVFYKNLSLTTAVQWTVHDRTPADHPVSAGRVVLGLTYSLPQMRYLLGK